MPERLSTDEATDPTSPFLQRRTVLRGAAVAGIAAVPLLAACGSDDESPSGGGTDSSKTPESSDPPKSEEQTEDGGGGGGGDALTTTADVPEGGGTIFDSEKVVVTQPAAGDFKAFTAVCTHSGCIVASVSDGSINCDCHGSKYSAEDGSVINGPATQPLSPVEIAVDGDNISLA